MSFESLSFRYKKFVVPNSWWKMNFKTHYRYRKIISTEIIHNFLYLKVKDSHLTSTYRLDWFLENHVPIQSKWEFFYARLNHLTNGILY